jgi:DNA-binding LacI/PurR family transcriptional regulator
MREPGLAPPREKVGMTTTKDIAQRLNLSVSTVGRALADDARISPETKLRVTKVAEELGYVANRAARIMRGAPSTMIGLIVPDVRNSFFSTVAHALTETMSEQNHQLLLCETGDDRTSELRQVRDLAAAQVAGIIIVPSAHPKPQAIQLLRSIPHVQFLRRLQSLSPHWFGVDDHNAAFAATTHLLELGHRRVAYIGGTDDVTSGADRLAGFQAAVAAHGLPASAGIVALGPPSSTLRGGATHGRASFRRLMGSDEPPTGIVTGSVPVSRGLLEVIQQEGPEVPRDLSVVGFGDEIGFSWWGPGLTTVAVPGHELATACGTWLLRRLRSPEIAEEPYHSMSSGTLIVRGSASRPPGSVRNGDEPSFTRTEAVGP